MLKLTCIYLVLISNFVFASDLETQNVQLGPGEAIISLTGRNVYCETKGTLETNFDQYLKIGETFKDANSAGYTVMYNCTDKSTSTESFLCFFAEASTDWKCPQGLSAVIYGLNGKFIQLSKCSLDADSIRQNLRAVGVCRD